MIRVRFCGTRGTLTTPGKATLRYGGNTPCIQVVGFDGMEPGAAARWDNPQLILDGGTGILSLVRELMRGPCGRGLGELHILLSHFHWDHLLGIPFFTPMFIRGNRIVFYGPSVEAVQSSIERLFTSVYSPVKRVQNVAADLEYRRVEPEGMEIAGFQVRAADNWHQGGCLSFRIAHGRHTVVYTTDHEIGDPAVDANLVALARGTDLWVLDAEYGLEERLRRTGWGHSSPSEAVKLAVEAGVRTAALFHHDPQYDDAALDAVGREAAELSAGTGTEVVTARDGMVVEIGSGL